MLQPLAAVPACICPICIVIALGDIRPGNSLTIGTKDSGFHAKVVIVC